MSLNRERNEDKPLSKDPSGGGLFGSYAPTTSATSATSLFGGIPKSPRGNNSAGSTSLVGSAKPASQLNSLFGGSNPSGTSISSNT